MMPHSTSAIIFGFHGPKLLPQERAFFAKVNPSGFILFARNIENRDQLTGLTQDLRDAVGWNAPIMIDQEGGRVQRLRAPMVNDWPAPLDHASRGDPQAIYDRYYLISQELLSFGIDMNCAPCLDIARRDTHPFLYNRCLGTTVDDVVRNGRAALNGHLEAGVVPIIKHMPGHGLAKTDSHKSLPMVSEDQDSLMAHDFAAFKVFADAPIAMSAHIVFSAFDHRPATISPVMINLIRETLGFSGLLISDDISMEALPGAIEARAVNAVTAGCDMALHCNGNLDEMQRIADAVPSLSTAAQARADRALALRSDKRPTELDIKELYATLLGS